jgi:hypothetical protein
MNSDSLHLTEFVSIQVLYNKKMAKQNMVKQWHHLVGKADAFP